MSGKNKRNQYQEDFIKGFTGKNMGIKRVKVNTPKQDQSRAARDKRRKARLAERKEG